MELLIPSIGLIFWTLLWLALWLIALIDVLRGDFTNGNDKLIWILVIIFVPLLGSILYFIIGRRNKIKHN